MSQWPHRSQASSLISQLQDRLPDYAAEKLAAAISPGATPDDALSLVAACPNTFRGWVAVLFYLMRDDLAFKTCREGFATAWRHDHQSVIDAAGNSSRMRAMFRHCGTPPQSEVRGEIRVWRGAHGVDATTAARGISWTLDRDVACWFAGQHSHRAPIVVAADIDAAEIVHFDDGRDEREVVLGKCPAWFVDGCSADWIDVHRRVNGARRAGATKLKS